MENNMWYHMMLLDGISNFVPRLNNNNNNNNKILLFSKEKRD